MIDRLLGPFLARNERLLRARRVLSPAAVRCACVYIRQVRDVEVYTAQTTQQEVSLCRWDHIQTPQTLSLIYLGERVS